MKLGFALYAIMLLSGGIQAFLGTDEAAKYIAPEALFWARGINSIVAVMATGLKAFTSEAFGKWVEARKNGNGNTNTGP